MHPGFRGLFLLCPSSFFASSGCYFPRALRAPCRRGSSRTSPSPVWFLVLNAHQEVCGTQSRDSSSEIWFGETESRNAMGPNYGSAEEERLGGNPFCRGQGPGGGHSELLGGVEAPFSTGVGDTGGAAMMEVQGPLEGQVSSRGLSSEWERAWIQTV